MMDIDPGQLRALTAAVSEGTFDGAARALHVTPSAISQRIKSLEASVGRVLLTRTKPIAATPSGETLLRLARQVELLTADAASEIDGVPLAQIPLAVNADSLASWLLPALHAAGDGLSFDLHRDDQELTAELLRRGIVMAAITGSAEPVPGCTVERLGRMRYRPRASSAFVGRWFTGGVTVAALAEAPVVTFDRTDQLQDGYLRRRSRRRLDPPRHLVPDSAAFVEAIRLGLGWGMLPDLIAARTELADLDPRGITDVALYWQQWKLRSASLDRVAAAVRAHAASALV